MLRTLLRWMKRDFLIGWYEGRMRGSLLRARIAVGYQLYGELQKAMKRYIDSAHIVAKLKDEAEKEGV